MDLALYAPGQGYYAAGSTKFGAFGAGGDFVTAPEMSPAFAEVLAGQIAPVLAACGPRIVEFGAGTGQLALDLIGALARRGIALAQYAIVEVSADLRARQAARLCAPLSAPPAPSRAASPVAPVAGSAAASATGSVVRWLDAPPRDLHGVIIANEVLDVMPVRLFVRLRDGVAERGVEVAADGGLRLALRPAPADLCGAVAAIEAQLGPLPEGYGAEIGVVAQGWAASLADWLGHGVALLIDYGFPRREYYHPQRLMGTLMCHYRHRAHADPLWLPGLNDITAHVDFTAIADAAHAAGLDVLGYTSQGRFLLEGGLLDTLRDAGIAARVQAQRLVSEAEMGELFKVLAIGRGAVPVPSGFARGDRLHTL
jgi:SAM-dependent MidA family methyltransferase